MGERRRNDPGHGWESGRNDSWMNGINVSGETTHANRKAGEKMRARKGGRRNDMEITIIVTYQSVKVI